MEWEESKRSGHSWCLCRAFFVTQLAGGPPSPRKRRAVQACFGSGFSAGGPKQQRASGAESYSGLGATHSGRIWRYWGIAGRLGAASCPLFSRSPYAYIWSCRLGNGSIFPLALPWSFPRFSHGQRDAPKRYVPWLWSLRGLVALVRQRE